MSTVELPRLEIVPVERVVPHEHHDHQRTPPLIHRIRASGVFRDPPIVMPLRDGSGRYMILDGTNRTMAIRQMGIPHLLVQIVEPDDPGVTLKTWNHMVWGLSPEAWLEGLQAHLPLALQPVELEEGYRALHAHQTLVVVSLPDGRAFAAEALPAEASTRLDYLNRLVTSYIHRAQVDRTLSHRAPDLVALHPDLAGVIVFPPFAIPQVLDAVAQGQLFPAGITRFTIAPRALRLYYPLEALAATGTLEEKNRVLQQWIQERVARKGVRYYAEPTVLFDE